MTFVVVAHYTTTTDAAEAVARGLATMESASRLEPGCLYYRVHQSTQTPELFMLYEEYEDESAYDVHRNTMHFKRLVEGEIAPLLTSRERTFFTPLTSSAS